MVDPPPRGSSGKVPSGSACHVSIRASGIASPLPSSTCPRIQNAPGVPIGAARRPSSPQSSPMPRYGPTVWEGVRPSSPVAASVPPVASRGASLIVLVLLVFEDAGVRSPQDDVELEGQRPVVL